MAKTTTDTNYWSDEAQAKRKEQHERKLAANTDPHIKHALRLYHAANPNGPKKTHKQCSIAERYRDGSILVTIDDGWHGICYLWDGNRMERVVYDTGGNLMNAHAQRWHERYLKYVEANEVKPCNQ